MRVLHAVADRGEEPEPLPDGWPALFDGAVQGPAIDELHREEGLGPGRGVERPGLEDLRDRRMLEPGEQLRLEFEATQRLGRGDAGPDQLERDRALRARLGRPIDHPETTDPQNRFDREVGEHGPRRQGGAQRGLRGGGRPRGRPRIEHVVARPIVAQQRHHGVAQRRIVPAPLAHERRPALGRLLDRIVEDLFDTSEEFGIHAGILLRGSVAFLHRARNGTRG